MPTIVKTIQHKGRQLMLRVQQATRSPVLQNIRSSVTSGLLIIVGATIALMPSALTHAQTTFSINTSDLLSNAATIFNGFWPIFAVVVGIGLGFSILKFVAGMFKGAL